MRRVSIVALAIVLIGASSAFAAIPVWSAPKHLHAKPALGTRFTAFKVRFLAGPASGQNTFQSISYRAQAVSKRTAHGCVNYLSVPVTVRRAGQHVTAVLKPSAYSAGWCSGGFSGWIYELSSPRCGPVVAAPVSARRPALVCPLFASREFVLGTFSFRVR